MNLKTMLWDRIVSLMRGKKKGHDCGCSSRNKGRWVQRGSATQVAARLGADVVVMDINLNRLRYLDEITPPMAQIHKKNVNAARIIQQPMWHAQFSRNLVLNVIALIKDQKRLIFSAELFYYPQTKGCFSAPGLTEYAAMFDPFSFSYTKYANWFFRVNHIANGIITGQLFYLRRR